MTKEGTFIDIMPRMIRSEMSFMNPQIIPSTNDLELLPKIELFLHKEVQQK